MVQAISKPTIGLDYAVLIQTYVVIGRAFATILTLTLPVTRHNKNKMWTL